MKTLYSLTLLLAMIGFITGCSTESDNTAASDTSEPENIVDDGGDVERAKLVGQYFGLSSGMNDLGLSESEKRAVIEGFSSVLNDAEVDRETIAANITEVRAFMSEKIEAKNARDAAGNLAEAEEYIQQLKAEGNVTFTESGLGYEILEAGSDEIPNFEDVVQVTYEGRLMDGTVFDSNLDAENPISFPLSGVIKGFSEGLQLIGDGGSIRLYIPSEIGYGNRPPQGSPIEAGSLLIFDLTIHGILRSGEQNLQVPPPPPAPQQ